MQHQSRDSNEKIPNDSFQQDLYTKNFKNSINENPQYKYEEANLWKAISWKTSA